MPRERISSPTSTGGAGTFFEQHVAAYWLAQLLVQGIPPVLIHTTVAEVSLQTELLGWKTDDFLIVCERPGAAPQKIAGQVKRSFTVSATDDECKKAIQDFWQDFKNPARFSAIDDRLMLVTLRGTNILLEHFVGLLDCARAARDGAEFEHRLATKGLISNKAVHYCDELRKIIADFEGNEVAAATLWPFLRLLHVLSLDLFTSTSQTEAQIKNLLRHMAKGGSALEIAETSWNTLLVLASEAMSEALSLRRGDLPDELKQRHTSVGADEQRVLRALHDHTDFVLRRIRSKIGGFHLQRTTLVQKVFEELELAQVVLVTGPAGSGKSGIGKDVVSLLSQSHFAFGFRVEEFAYPHLDTALQAAQIPANGTTLSAILAAQGRKIVLIESVERLLEKTTRDAFSDLMTLAAADRSLCIVLTCRDYSTEQVRASFLQPAGIKHAIVSIPPLDDSELTDVEVAIPELMYPLKSPGLRNILRNPYFLDKALEITWSAERPVPESEREFRALFWLQVVRADQSGLAGMAQRRAETFQEIAVRRARALSPFVKCNDLDPNVVEVLKQESLIVSSDEHPSLVATAHDVLEDWAILQWLEEVHLTNHGSFKELSAAIGTHPAIRRSYRKWLEELITRAPDSADSLFIAAITASEISDQFRDDTLVSLLNAPTSSEFLTRHETKLLANDKAILKRVVHLLRVACVTAPAWLAGMPSNEFVFYVPDGPSWAAVLELTHRNIDRFSRQERPLLVGLIEDAVRGVSWQSPKPDGEEYVAGIGYWLLAGSNNYRSGELRERVLKVIAKIPNADAANFAAILQSRHKEDEWWDRTGDDLRKLIFSGLEGMPAARDFPDLFVAVARDYILASDEDLQEDRHYRSSLNIEIYFGVKEDLSFQFYPESAFHGPWISFLRSHPWKALEFVIGIFDHSADWYVHPRAQNPLEPAWEIELTFADGTIHKQWGNERLWNLYRGTSVGPNVLQCLLMALEKWLLECATSSTKGLDEILVAILGRSKSASLAAVVASVATAHPLASGEALLILLSGRDYILFDRTRMASEFHSSALSNMFPHSQAEHKIYSDERAAANGLPHRQQDLEAAIATLQLGPLAPRVQALLDRHLSLLPPESEQDESDLLWRLAIHRMDLRQYTVTETTGPDVLNAETDSGETQKTYIQFTSKPPAPAVQAMVDAGAAKHREFSSWLGTWMWGVHVFEHKGGAYDPSLWRQNLAKARTIDIEVEQGDGSLHAPGYIAAVCVRDHWEEMSDDERGWCVDTICSEISRRSDQWGHIERLQRFSMGGDRPCAAMVPVLLRKPLTEPQMARVRQAFALALTHPIEEVRWYATWRIDGQFWATNRALALRCVNAVAAEANLLEQSWIAEEKKPRGKRRDYDELRAQAATTILQQFWQEGAFAEDALTTVDISKGHGAEAIGRMLVILGNVPEDPLAVTTFARASQTLVEWWSADKADREHRRNYTAASTITEHLQRFAMRTSPESALEVLSPILDAIDRHPDDIYWVVQGLTSNEDSNPTTVQYWYLWGLFADRIKRAKWIARLDDEYPTGREMLSAIFLTLFWKDSTRHWNSLEGYAHHVQDLFEALPPTAIVLDNYVRFLYHIGERSLPGAFAHIAESLNSGNAPAMLAKSNTVFMLEVLLKRHIYGRPFELKRSTALRTAVLSLLDILVENGSSAAFRMRDDFVTPAA